MTTIRRIPYKDRDEIEKLETQWKKIAGHYADEQWSAAIVRAATCAELAATLAIRNEFEQKSDLSEAFVDSLLRWANGISGKINKLLWPLIKGRPHYKDIKDLCKLAEPINEKRNLIVHSGEFADKKTADELIRNCRVFVTGIVDHYYDNFELDDFLGQNGKKKKH